MMTSDAFCVETRQKKIIFLRSVHKAFNAFSKFALFLITLYALLIRTNLKLFAHTVTIDFFQQLEFEFE